MAKLWNISDELSNKVTVKDKDKDKDKNTNFHQEGNRLIQYYAQLKTDVFNDVFETSRNITITRGEAEVKFWKKEINRIYSYSRKKAINELVKSMKINKKISAIQNYINSLKGK